VGDRLKVRTHYAEDEQNTEIKTALMVKVGGSAAGKSHGIHWHVDPNHTIRYLADPSRETIYEVELNDSETGGTKVYKTEEAAPAGSEWRTMDCIDCHNRPSHIYRSPQFEVDLALEQGRIDKTLPFIKREGVRIVTEKEYASHAEARAGIAAAVKAFYAENYPDLADSPAVEQAGKALGDAYAWNNFPHMKVTWNLYPNHIGHQDSPGCFRCHDNKHKTADGDKIGKKCGTCHNIVADEESDSALLQELGLQEAPPSRRQPRKSRHPRLRRLLPASSNRSRNDWHCGAVSSRSSRLAAILARSMVGAALAGGVAAASAGASGGVLLEHAVSMVIAITPARAVLFIISAYPRPKTPVQGRARMPQRQRNTIANFEVEPEKNPGHSRGRGLRFSASQLRRVAAHRACDWPYQARRGRSVFGCASFTFSGRPSIECPLRLWMARAASAFDISTKPKPRGWPVSRSVIRATDSTVPCWPNSVRTAASSAVKGRLPT
jgi:hypothetical protein